MGPGAYNCALDKQGQSNLLCFERFYTTEDGRTLGTTIFYNSWQFAKQQAGLAWRSDVEGTVSITDTYFDYHMDAHVVDEVEYGNGTRSVFVVTNAPCHAGAGHEIDVAGVLNACMDAWLFRKNEKAAPDCLGFREYKILKHLERLDYIEKDKVFEATDVDGDSCTFKIVAPCNVEVVG